MIERFSKFGGGIFYLTAVLQMPIFFFTGWKSYLFIYVLLMCCFSFMIVVNKINLLTQDKAYFYLYLSIIIALTGLSFFMQPINVVLVGVMTYLFFQLFFFLYMSSFKLEGLLCIAKVNTYCCLLVGVLAQYQVSVDPCLFGLYSGTYFEAFDLIGEQRGASVLGSIQVYAAYMAFSVILYDSFMARNNWKSKGVCLLMIYLGLLSGSMAFVFSMLIYFFITKINNKNVLWILIILVCISAFILNHVEFFDLLDDRSPLYRVLYKLFIGDDTNEVRVDRWLNAVAVNDMPLFGLGVGSLSTSIFHTERYNTESALLSMYMEGGVMLLAAFGILIAKLGSSNASMYNRNKLAYISVLLFYFFIVHVHDAVCLPIIWVLMFGFIMLDNGHFRKNNCDPVFKLTRKGRSNVI